MTTTETFEQQWQRHAAEVTQANTLNKDIVFDALAAASITLVTVSFDGAGDSGQIEDVIAYQGENQFPIPSATLTLQTAAWGRLGIRPYQAVLTEAIKDLCYGYLEQTHAGWENNDGACGEFTLSVEKRTVELEFTGRFTD